MGDMEISSRLLLPVQVSEQGNVIGLASVSESAM